VADQAQSPIIFVRNFLEDGRTVALNLSSVGTAPQPSTLLAVPRDQGLSAQRRSASGAAAGAAELSDAQQRQVEQLKRIDRQVREHEQAHLRVAGNLAMGSASYSYTYGPDGKAYATGGEVRIDTSAEQQPEANIDKGQRLQAAALAPADPSPQDYQVAAVGAQLEAKGRGEQAESARETSPTERKVASAYAPYQASAEGSIVDIFG
jgi:hypothetical protein